MSSAAKYKYGSMSLSQLQEMLDKEWYDVILSSCVRSGKQLENLLQREGEKPTQYLVQCGELLAEIEQFIRDRKGKYMPYIASLSEKVATSHNCLNCTGNCKLNHELQLWELKNSGKGIKDILNALQMLSLPLYTETLYPEAYRVLRNHVSLLESNIAELFFIEESYLLPKVTEAQKTINAGSH